jgi:hypothetical protein
LLDGLAFEPEVGRRQISQVAPLGSSVEHEV